MVLLAAELIIFPTTVFEVNVMLFGYSRDISFTTRFHTFSEDLLWEEDAESE